MQNIVTGNTNNPEFELAQERDIDLPQGQVEQSSIESPDSMDESTKPPQQDKDTTVGSDQTIARPLEPMVPIQPALPVVNPNLVTVTPDSLYWNQNTLNQLVGQDLVRQPLPISDVVNGGFSLPNPPTVQGDLAGQIQTAYNETLRLQRHRATNRALLDLMDYRSYQHTPPSDALSGDTQIPGSNRSVLRNNPRQGSGEPSEGGNLFTQWWDATRAQFNVIDQGLREIWGHVSGSASESQREAMRELLAEYVFRMTREQPGSPEINSVQDALQYVGQAFPQTSEALIEGLETISPVPNPTTGEAQGVNLGAGTFGEFGRGTTGLSMYGLSLPENLMWAAVYGTLDTARALAGDAGDNIPLLNRIPRDDDRSGYAYRFGQVFSGVDLDLVNVRDGSGNRYLAMIPEGEDLNTQINWGIAAFGISALLGNPVDDFIGTVRRTAPVLAEGLLRGQGFGDALEAARRLERINALRRARQTPPLFGQGEQARVVQSGDEATELQELTEGQELTRNLDEATVGQQPTQLQPQTVLQGADAEEYQRLLTEAENAASIYSTNLSNPLAHVYQPTAPELARASGTTPLEPLPLPFFVPRTNDELLNLGQQLGDIPPSRQILTNQDLYRLQEEFGETYARFGSPLDEVPPFQRVVDEDTLKPPDTTTVQRAREELQEMFPDANVEPLIRDLDEYGAVSRGLQELERQIDDLRRITINDGARLNTDLAPYVRPVIADEIAQRAKEGTRVEATEIKPLLEPQVVNKERISPLVTQVPWYHGTRQTDIANVSYLDGTPHEYGYGLYLTSSVDYARIASTGSRTLDNPIPGTTRLTPNGRGNVLEVLPEVANPLDLDDVPPEVYQVFKNAANMFGKPFRNAYAEILGDNARESWLLAREIYGERFGTPMTAFQYRGFSQLVNEGLRSLGYDGVYDAKRGILTAMPDMAGRIPMETNVVESGIGTGRRVEANYARHFLDAELERSIPMRTTEAQELQSRVAYQGSLMEDLIRSYRAGSQDAAGVVDSLGASEQAVINTTIAQAESELRQLQQSAPAAAIETPEFQQFRTTPLDNPCL